MKRRAVLILRCTQRFYPSRDIRHLQFAIITMRFGISIQHLRDHSVVRTKPQQTQRRHTNNQDKQPNTSIHKATHKAVAQNNRLGTERVAHRAGEQIEFLEF